MGNLDTYINNEKEALKILLKVGKRAGDRLLYLIELKVYTQNLMGILQSFDKWFNEVTVLRYLTEEEMRDLRDKFYDFLVNLMQVDFQITSAYHQRIKELSSKGELDELLFGASPKKEESSNKVM